MIYLRRKSHNYSTGYPFCFVTPFPVSSGPHPTTVFISRWKLFIATFNLDSFSTFRRDFFVFRNASFCSTREISLLVKAFLTELERRFVDSPDGHELIFHTFWTCLSLNIFVFSFQIRYHESVVVSMCVRIKILFPIHEISKTAIQINNFFASHHLLSSYRQLRTLNANTSLNCFPEPFFRIFSSMLLSPFQTRFFSWLLEPLASNYGTNVLYFVIPGFRSVLISRPKIL